MSKSDDAWDEEARQRCGHMNEAFQAGFVGGAKWQRSQPDLDLSKVTRVTVVSRKQGGRVFEGWNFYDNGAGLSLQDDGRTLKIIPAEEAL